MNLLEELAIQGWTITIVFVDGFYIDVIKGTEKYSSFHAQNLHMAIMGLLLKLPITEFSLENTTETHENGDTRLYKGSGIYCERCKEEVSRSGEDNEWLECRCGARRSKVEEWPSYWRVCQGRDFGVRYQLRSEEDGTYLKKMEKGE